MVPESADRPESGVFGARYRSWELSIAPSTNDSDRGISGRADHQAYLQLQGFDPERVQLPIRRPSTFCSPQLAQLPNLEYSNSTEKVMIDQHIFAPSIISRSYLPSHKSTSTSHGQLVGTENSMVNITTNQVDQKPSTTRHLSESTRVNSNGLAPPAKAIIMETTCQPGDSAAPNPSGLDAQSSIRKWIASFHNAILRLKGPSGEEIG
ncbi:hypothetical protein BDV12DRAFT_205085 [Aspergillus spectabilis]